MPPHYKIIQVFLLSLASLLGAFLTSPARADTAIPLFEADYVLKRSGFSIGTMHRSLRKEEGVYVFESRVKPRGFLSLFSRSKIHEKSIWQWTGSAISSIDFSYTSGTDKTPKRSSIHFEPKKSVASGQYKTHEWQLSLPKEGIPTYDKANYQIALMHDVRLKKKPLIYRFIKKGKLTTYKFERLGEEIIKTSIGHFNAIKLQRQAGKRSTTIWLAPALDYTPIKIEQIEKAGEKYTLRLKSYQRK